MENQDFNDTLKNVVEDGLEFKWKIKILTIH